MTMIASSPGTTPMRVADERLAPALPGEHRHQRQQNEVGSDEKRQTGNDARGERALLQHEHRDERPSGSRRHIGHRNQQMCQKDRRRQQQKRRQRANGSAAGRFPAQQVGEPQQ